MKIYTFLILVFFSLAISNCQTSNRSEESQLPENLVERIDLVDLEGKPISMESLKGKTVFLNFWATWCKPCLAEMPDMDIAAKVLAEDDFIFIAASDESIEKIKKFAEKYDYSFKFVHSKTSVFDLELGALPTTWVINKEGVLVYNEVGARKWDSEEELNNLRDLAKK